MSALPSHISTIPLSPLLPFAIHVRSQKTENREGEGERRRKKEGEEGEEEGEGGRRRLPAATMMEVAAGKFLHATTPPELEEKAPSSIIFYLKLHGEA